MRHRGLNKKSKVGQTMKNNLTTTQKTEVVLAKGKSLLNITAKILSSSKALATVQTHKDITIIGDLMWENVDNHNEHNMNWDDAMEYAKNLRQGGYDDWRLPTIDELKLVVRESGGINVTRRDDDWEAIRDENKANESYQANYKEKGFASRSYWSSTTYTGLSGYAWVVLFGYGYQGTNYKSISVYVRCVRAGQ